MMNAAISNGTPPHIVIIGGGLAGTVTAIKLARAAARELRITVIESRAELGRGIAYSTRDPAHLVNGPAKYFTLYPDQPEHLALWLQSNAARGGWQAPTGVAYAESFPPRHVYGAYVQTELQNALAQNPHGVQFRHEMDRAVDLDRDGDDRWIVRLASGRAVIGDRVVLATGLFPSSLGRGDFEMDPVLFEQGRIIDDLWNVGELNGIDRDRDLLVVGNSLSALDAMITAHSLGFRGMFHTLSRRGLLVARRRGAEPWPSFLDAQALPGSLRELLRQVRTARREVARVGADWQRLPGAIKPHLPALWARATEAERKRFIRHLRPYWEIALHCASPESGDWLQGLRNAGRHRMLTGRIRRLSPSDGGRITVTWQERGGERHRMLEVDRVFNARGFEFDWRRIDDPLVRNLLAKGLVVPHQTGFGINANPETGAVLPAGCTDQGVGLYAVGHPLRGVAWESNAIGEHVVGATVTAAAVVASLTPSLVSAA